MKEDQLMNRMDMRRYELRCASDRMDLVDATPIYVRALDPEGNMIAANLAQLDADSVIRWLRSKGEYSTIAEQTVLVLLGHRRASQVISAIDGG